MANPIELFGSYNKELFNSRSLVKKFLMQKGKDVISKFQVEIPKEDGVYQYKFQFSQNRGSFETGSPVDVVDPYKQILITSPETVW